MTVRKTNSTAAIPPTIKANDIFEIDQYKDKAEMKYIPHLFLIAQLFVE